MNMKMAGEGLAMDLHRLGSGALVALVVAAGFVYLVASAVYNIYFHPLARFPGPLLWRITRLGFAYRHVTGSLPRDMLAIHKQYGPVVRIAPDELAFSSPEAWKDIYGHKLEELPKDSRFYRTPGIPPSLISEDRHNHALLRRELLPQFSDRKMHEQEPIFGGYIDLLMTRLQEHAVDTDRKDPVTGGPARRPLDMVAWYTWTTFDIIGDLAFGEPFGCLNRAKDDPWVAAISKSFRWLAIVNMIKHLGLGGFLPLAVKLNKGDEEHRARTRAKLERRLGLEVERPDLIEGLLRKKEEWGLSDARLHINASMLIVAGSETTATLLCGVTYLLLHNPEAMRKVTEEVRAAFASEKDITLTSVGKLTYMLACLNEALRQYPPVAIGMPRVVPEGRGAVTIAGQAVPEKTVVSVWQWATYHNDENFADPFNYHPERFLQDPKFAGDRLEALQPFSLGPRDCIGRNLAYAEMRLILARILYNFDMELVDKDLDWLDQRGTVLWEKKPLQVFLTPVKRFPNLDR